MELAERKQHLNRFAFVANNSDVLMGFAAMSILMVMVIPIPAILLDLFLSARGNLKEVQRALGVSYPTARSRIDGMFQKLGQVRSGDQPMEVLQRLRTGEIDGRRAAAELAARAGGPRPSRRAQNLARELASMAGEGVTD